MNENVLVDEKFRLPRQRDAGTRLVREGVDSIKLRFRPKCFRTFFYRGIMNKIASRNCIKIFFTAIVDRILGCNGTKKPLYYFLQS
jgi:hypothetical protein